MKYFFLKNLIYNTFSYQIKRSLKIEVRNKLREKSSPKHTALEYYDFFYSTSFGSEWNKIRLALLTGSKYAALINNYSIYNQSIEKIENLTAINLFDFVTRNKLNSIENSNQTIEEKNASLELLSKLKIPSMLKVFCFENGDIRQFPSPTPTDNGLLNYYCLDGASILPVLALNIQKDDTILDLCASPGGKTLAMLQTMLPSKITCRDISSSRIDRLNRMLRSYIDEATLNKKINIEMNSPGFGIPKKADLYDKVLVDVPCTNDRASLFKDKNNIFSKYRVDERTEIPQTQANLLRQAIELCKLNGTIVYSTCSLSPIQNEGVINSVLNSYGNNSKFKLEIESLEYIKFSLDYFFTFSNSCKLGLLVTPDINKNFGPFYVCKINKISH